MTDRFFARKIRMCWDKPNQLWSEPKQGTMRYLGREAISVPQLSPATLPEIVY